MAKQWYYQVMGSEVGPISSAELKNRVQKGMLQPDMPVRVGPDGLAVDLAPVEVGRLALAAGVSLSALAASGTGLEDEFLALVADPERAAEGGRQR